MGLSSKRDANFRPAIFGVSSVDLKTPTAIKVNPTTGAMLIDKNSLDSTDRATFTTPGSVLQTVYNVRDYGAKGDGATDDTAAIQAAINALPSNGGIVFMPEGTYKTSSTIALTQYQRLVGSGIEATKIIANASTFHVIHMGNRQADGIMRNFMGLEEMSVSSAGGANNYDTVWVDGGGNGTHIVNVKASEGKYNFRLTDIDQSYFIGIKGFNPRTASIYCEVGLENTWGNVAFYSPAAALSDNNTTAWLFAANANQSSPNLFDRVSIYGGLIYSTAGLTGTTGLKMVVGATSFTILGTLFENNMTHINLVGTTFMSLISDSFIQNSGVSTDIVKLETNNHTVSFYDCRFQQATNGFNGSSGYSHVGFFGKNTNQGNITNLLTGSFGSKYGTDTVFAGDGTLALGLNNQKFGYVFTQVITGESAGLQVGESGGASGCKVGFFGASTIVQPVLATGTGKTADNIITVLQNLGLVRQS